ncbi:MAG TPA: flagellar hook-basal body protein [Solirubrobacteraceae bacterium]|jgi:flagellar basal-body rod protein FlgG|nr:flagellar hook-basal body protein [Solirubrobacteraceae bacterium]
MLEGLYSAAAGMSAQQEQLDAVSNDLANISTTGYQSERVAFSDLLYNAVDEAGTESSIGAGASAQAIGRSHAQGPIQETGDPLDLAIEGEGYFQVKGPGGQPALTRDGSFAVGGSGTIVDAEGNSLEPPIKLPAGASAAEVKIGIDGSVSAGKRTLGQIKLVTVASPDHLLAGGGGTLTPTTASGAIQPVASGAAKIRQGALEGSNVDMSKEMALMVSTQRAYQMSSSAIQTESQMMSIANELRPS